MSDTSLLRITGLSVDLGHGIRSTRVLHDVDLGVERGRTVGIVGESGSGKSTLAKTIVGLHRVAAGSVVFDGVELASAPRATVAAVRRRVQYVPQDPYSSLDPRRTIGQTLAEAIDPVGARQRRHHARIVEVLASVALGADAVDRYPHEFSGGQRQRIAIARALAVNPDVIVADEITSALDVSTQAEILRLLEKLQRERNLTMLFISHNLAVVEQLCDEVVVLLHGGIVEQGPIAEVFADPREAYTRRLLESVPGGAAFDVTAPVVTAAVQTMPARGRRRGLR
ncbi:ABC transporter ATP-binding protein [Microbacterium sp. BH-3-3-3]|uniref:ABC transporter ATP-binding protein n=1 Tax=Microbacterium sp. BH-3-3-3 TaxID=1906742 RepID=UPI0008928A69|nr:ABC transporter ATP-binding protein [Microbacterium sp. BH-3-3-3]AOX45896.1 ABC transporter ATP-binding protein [Microbacterium sp. BH-3-3-3]